MFPFSVNNLITFQKVINTRGIYIFSVLDFLHEYCRFTGQQGKYFFEVLSTTSTRFTDISRVITAESSPLHKARGIIVRLEEVKIRKLEVKSRNSIKCRDIYIPG